MRLAPDKAFHLLAGYAIALTIAPAGLWWAFSAAVFAGAAKEAWDATGRGCVELGDFLSTVAGGLIGVAYAGCI